MKIIHRGYEPKVDASACIAPTAVLVGKVEVGSRSRVMYGAVVDSEASTISIGACCIVCENAVIRATGEGEVPHPITIDDHVFIGPHSTILGCTLARCVYVATGATILQGAKVGPGSVIASALWFTPMLLFRKAPSFHRTTLLLAIRQRYMHPATRTSLHE
jgi:carbonic anhydrase/acetyltransferase-like protein (isoleucine patch superfamily)